MVAEQLPADDRVPAQTDLERIIESRTLIGQAQGILMERFDLDAGTAFAVLRRYSQHANRKLHDIAEEFVRTRQPPDRERSPSSARPSTQAHPHNLP